MSRQKKDNIQNMLGLLKRIWRKNPNMTFGDLILSITSYEDLAYKTDQELYKLLSTKYNVNKQNETNNMDH